MSTLRISNIEAKSVPASATTDEKIKITNSSGDVLVFLDGKTSGITTVGINTTDGNLKFDANSNIVVSGIVTATAFYGDGSNLTGIAADKIFEGNTEVETVDTGSNGHIKFTTEGSERLRIQPDGTLVTGAQTIPTSSDIGNIYIKNASAIGSQSHQINYVSNAVFNGAWKYINSSLGATQIVVNQNSISVNFAPSGTAGNNITFSETLRISNDGTISFARGGGNQDPSHNPTVLNGKHRYSFDYSTDDSSIPFRGMKVYGSYGIGGGSTDYSYAALFDGGKTHNNCQNQYITFNQITQQLTAHTHGIYCQNSSSYGVSYCYEGKMMKNLGAYTNSYTYHSNIVTTNSGGSAYHFRGADNDTTKVLILQNGDLDNANNSYSGLSDIKLKENIVDAGSQWDDIKNLKVRKFNFKAETGHETHTQIGLIAQETEPVSAGLVYEENDITVDESTGEGTVTGTTKHIKYSVLYMKAVKALQEAMTRIETLEQDNIALRARITNLEGN